jgi:hypothetical protein
MTQTLCNQYVYNGVILRYVITFLSFGILLYNINNRTIHKYLFLIIPIWLTILDGTDGIFFLLQKEIVCYKTFYYQILDKICDSVSYFLFFLIFLNKNYLLLYFILYRLIGVIIFYFTKSSKWLVFFFDFIKEFLLYMFIFGKNYKYLPFFILCKIAFEYKLHMQIYKPHY